MKTFRKLAINRLAGVVFEVDLRERTLYSGLNTQRRRHQKFKTLNGQSLRACDFCFARNFKNDSF